jgi:hypothetical protein
MAEGPLKRQTVTATPAKPGGLPLTLGPVGIEFVLVFFDPFLKLV